MKLAKSNTGRRFVPRDKTATHLKVLEAAREEFMSLPFILLYGLEILILAFYAVGWQQFIKRMPLSVAYANKAVTVIWGCVWGVLIFHEHLTLGKVAGALLVLCGVALYGIADGKAGKADE